MTIAASVENFLNQAHVPYDVVAHRHTWNSTYTAQAAHIPGDRLAKCVMLEDSQGYLMAVLPATHMVDLGAVRQVLGRPVGLATEGELAGLFMDCEPGAIPPLAQAYGVDAIVDESLLYADDVYFEGGDHCALIHVNGRDFRKLMSDALRGQISHQHRH
ncbi:MAG TPA: YbaK/EbsC family protein [Povalibacter sp.]|nr:YbaK/EbsC family protein [Povalibacter sp.]